MEGPPPRRTRKLPPIAYSQLDLLQDVLEHAGDVEGVNGVAGRIARGLHGHRVRGLHAGRSGRSGLPSRPPSFPTSPTAWAPRTLACKGQSAHPGVSLLPFAFTRSVREIPGRRDGSRAAAACTGGAQGAQRGRARRVREPGRSAFRRCRSGAEPIARSRGKGAEIRRGPERDLLFPPALRGAALRGAAPRAR